MTWTQESASAYVQRMAGKVADYLGLTLPNDITVSVVNGGTSATSGGAITIGKGMSKDYLLFEISNAVLRAQAGDANQGAAGKGTADTNPSIALGSAVVRHFLGENPPWEGNYKTHIDQVEGLNNNQRAALAGDVQSGNFSFANNGIDKYKNGGGGTTGGGTDLGNINGNITDQAYTGPGSNSGAGGGGNGNGSGNGNGNGNGNGDFNFTGGGAAAGQQAIPVPSLLNTLNDMGIPVDQNTRALAIKAHQNNWTTGQFLHAVRTSPDYAKYFPGIVDQNGVQIMSERQYENLVKSYQGIAATSGLSIGRNEAAHLITGNVSPDEFKNRVAAISRIEQYKPAFQQFNAYLKATGQPQMTEADIQKFVLGEGSPEFYKMWNEVSTRISTVQAGIKIGPHAEGAFSGSQNIGDVSLNRKEVKQISAASGGQATAAQYADLANKLQTLLPQSRIQKLGLSKEDLVQLEFGGPKQAHVAAQVQQILANQGARESGQGQATLATGQVGQSQRGVNEGF